MITDFCVVCGIRECLENHHIVPRSMGGTDEPENLLTLCYTHHKGMHGVSAERNIDVSALTKAALHKLKAQGVALGPKNKKLTAEDSAAHRAAWNEKRKALSVAFAKQMLPIIEDLLDKGMNYSQVALELNNKNYPTPSGKGTWACVTVKRCVARVKEGVLL